MGFFCCFFLVSGAWLVLDADLVLDLGFDADLDLDNELPSLLNHRFRARPRPSLPCAPASVSTVGFSVS
ncbi:hypothetical protein MTO96_040434 [Rhipicephalus appendiculatus]